MRGHEGVDIDGPLGHVSGDGLIAQQALLSHCMLLFRLHSFSSSVFFGGKKLANRKKTLKAFEGTGDRWRQVETEEETLPTHRNKRGNLRILTARSQVFQDVQIFQPKQSWIFSFKFQWAVVPGGVPDPVEKKNHKDHKQRHDHKSW